MTDRDRIHLLCEIFEWPTNDEHFLYHALMLLHRMRGEEPPTFDDFRAMHVT